MSADEIIKAARAYAAYWEIGYEGGRMREPRPGGEEYNEAHVADLERLIVEHCEEIRCGCGPARVAFEELKLRLPCGCSPSDIPTKHREYVDGLIGQYQSMMR